MPTDLSSTDADLVTRACLGAISGPDGPTDEQLTILRSIATHLWGLGDVDLSPDAALTAEEAGARLTDRRITRRTRELMVLLELCRHPLEVTHQQRVQDYCTALGEDGPGLALARTYVAQGADAASADYVRRFLPVAPEMMEPAMIEIAGVEDAEAARRLTEIDTALRGAGPGTLGAEFMLFYERNGFTVGPQAVPLFGHDMAHVIGGYDASPIGEICIGAMKLMMTDSDVHWIEFLGNLLIHETGVVPMGYVPHEPALADPANITLMVRAMERGRETRTDFSTVEHLSMIDWPYADVLEHFGVPPL